MINELWEVNSGGRTISQEDSRLDFYCGGGKYTVNIYAHFYCFYPCDPKMREKIQRSCESVRTR
jgi:hypothetical protein